MPPPEQRKPTAPISVRSLAEAMGTSRSTVSRAFRGEASVKPELRARILAEAERRGYRPDPLVSEVMTSFARRKPVDYRETLGVLWWPDRWGQSVAPASFANRLRSGLAAAAEKHGCRLTHFVLREDGEAALVRTLEARRIRGLVLTPPTVPGTEAPDLGWNRFSTVAIGRSLSGAAFHCVHHNHYGSMVNVLGRLRQRGYRRPVLLSLVDLEERMQRAYTGAFLAHEAGPAWRVLHLESRDAAEIEVRLRALSPDVVIADTEEWLKVFRAAPSSAKVPGFLALDVYRRDGPISGVHQSPERMAGHAIDLVMQARLHNETGLPEEPADVQTQGSWVEGKTLPDLHVSA